MQDPLLPSSYSTPGNSGARPPRNPASRKPPATTTGRRSSAGALGGNISSSNSSNIITSTSTTTSANNNNHHDAGGSSNSVFGAPSSVHCSSLLLHRTNSSHRDDMSDLSGSYHHAAAVVPTGDDAGPWRHAPRTRLPAHPQPHGDHDESSFHNRRGYTSGNLCRVLPLLLDDQAGGSIEVEALQSLHNQQQQQQQQQFQHQSQQEDAAARIPAIMLLMDPQRKKYEVMQLWMDPNLDTIREIIQAISRNLGDWKQDYDGLFQVRNNHFSQLIHVLSAGRYDILPLEVWVAKPWSMSAKVTVGYASTLLNHLKRLGVLEYKRAADFNNSLRNMIIRPKQPSYNSANNSSSGNNNDTVLVLSTKAQRRIYVPEGIMKHHHAAQFLSFVPMFEQISQVDVGDASSSVASGLSDSLAEEDPIHMTNSQHQRSKTGSSDDQSETESTYSTTGTSSPKPKNKLQHYVTTTNSMARAMTMAATDGTAHQSCDASAVTRASAYVLRTTRTSPPLPSEVSEQARGLARWLRALNCTKSSSASSVSSADPDPLLPSDSSKIRPRRMFDASDAASQSSGAPLLFSSRSDWVADE
jgi:hypothetical protein